MLLSSITVHSDTRHVAYNFKKLLHLEINLFRFHLIIMVIILTSIKKTQISLKYHFWFANELEIEIMKNEKMTHHFLKMGGQ